MVTSIFLGVTMFNLYFSFIDIIIDNLSGYIDLYVDSSYFNILLYAMTIIPSFIFATVIGSFLSLSFFVTETKIGLMKYVNITKK